jgi:hypothetical protein
MDPSAPAFGGMLIVTVTFALASAHDVAPATVYVYVPAFIVAGLIMPPFTLLGPLHVPPASGVPPNCAKSETVAPELQSAIEPSVPAFGGALIVTLTVAVSTVQGVVPETV